MKQNPFKNSGFSKPVLYNQKKKQIIPNRIPELDLLKMEQVIPVSTGKWEIVSK